MSDGENHQSASTIGNFFAELNPALEAARKLDREMNRIFAHRFNVLDYVHTRELGLSRIVADLFDPNASHGQGMFFIKSLLTRLKSESSCVVDEKWPHFDNKDVRVSLEKTIKANRRIDIYVTIKSKSGTAYCLAIENKPYADDQKHQVADYLEHLKKYGENFLLIYLSSRGQKPSNTSFPETEYKDGKWKGRFKIMAYYNEPGIAEMEFESAETDKTRERKSDGHADDEHEDYRISFSLADWLSECRKNCEVDRLRSFLRDAEQFCIKRFGDSNMASNSDTQAVKEVIYSGDVQRNLEIAMIVSGVWPVLEAEFYEKYVKFLKSKIEKKLKGIAEEDELFKDCKVEFRSNGVKAHQNGIWLFRETWKQYELSNESCRRTTAIYMKNDHNGPRTWVRGIASPIGLSGMSEVDKSRREKLKYSLQEIFRGTTGDFWLYSEHVEPSDWKKEIPKLELELKKGCGEFTNKLVERFLEIARLAIPEIDKLEMRV